MSNQLLNVNSSLAELENLPESKPSKEIAEAAFTGFTPNLRLFPASGKVVAGKPNLPGNWGLFTSKDQFTLLTNTILVIPLVQRVKAVDWRGKETKIVMDENDPEYLEIKEYCEEYKEKNKTSMGCEAMWGFEFLLLLAKGDKFGLAQIYLNNPTMRGQADSLTERLRKPTIMKSKLITQKENAWYGFECLAADVNDLPLIPPMSKIKPPVDKFLNPPKDEVVQEGTTENVNR